MSDLFSDCSEVPPEFVLGQEFEMRPRVEEIQEFDVETNFSADLWPREDKDDLKFCGNTKPFEELKNEMTALTEDGKVMKKVIKDGKELISEVGTIFFHYNCFADGFRLPFDSSILRSPNKPTRLRFGRDQTYDGLECSLRSMRVGETSQFLIHHERAFGKLGMPGRIPECATVLAEIHVCRFLEREVKDDDPVEMEDKTDFKTNYLKAYSSCDEASVYFATGDFKKSAVYYKKAESLLWDIRLKSDEEEELMKKLLVKTYVNLMVIFSKIRSPKRVVFYCREAFQISSHAHLNVKLYYNLGKAYIELLNFPLALKALRKALKLKPGNKDVLHLISLTQKELKAARPRNLYRADSIEEDSSDTDEESLFCVDENEQFNEADIEENCENRNPIINYEESSTVGDAESVWNEDEISELGS